MEMQSRTRELDGMKSLKGQGFVDGQRGREAGMLHIAAKSRGWTLNVVKIVVAPEAPGDFCWPDRVGQGGPDPGIRK